MAFQFYECNGLHRRVILNNIERLGEAEERARDWLKEHGYNILAFERDADHEAFDIMTERARSLYQFGIEAR